MEHWHDVLQVRDVIDRYATGIDRRDWELLRSCFAPNCVADYGRSGRWTEREPFVMWLDEIHRGVGSTLHRMTNHQVHVDGNVAAATSYFDAVLQVQHGDHDLLQVIGTYTDQLIRTEEGWKITARRAENTLWRRGKQNEG